MSTPGLLELLLLARVDDSEIDATQAKIDATVADWKMKRRDIMHGLAQVQQGISYTFQAIRTVIKAAGGTIGPVESAMMATISAAVSVAIATAVALETTVVFAWLGAILGAVALGLQIASLAKMAVEMDAARDRVAAAEAQIDRLMSMRTRPGGF